MNLKGHRPSGIDSLRYLQTEPAVEFQAWRPRGSEQENAVGRAEVSVQPALGDAEVRLLRAVLAHPGKPSSAYAKLSGLGTHQAIKARQRLIQDDYLREHRVSTGARGRTSKVLEPSPKAIKIIAEGSK